MFIYIHSYIYTYIYSSSEHTPATASLDSSPQPIDSESSIQESLANFYPDLRERVVPIPRVPSVPISIGNEKNNEDESQKSEYEEQQSSPCEQVSSSKDGFDWSVKVAPIPIVPSVPTFHTPVQAPTPIPISPPYTPSPSDLVPTNHPPTPDPISTQTLNPPSIPIPHTPSPPNKPQKPVKYTSPLSSLHLSDENTSQGMCILIHMYIHIFVYIK
jgi:hypothetical protein